MNINLNFSISELIKSDTAIKYNTNNMPDIQSLDNLLYLITYCLQPVRNILKKQMIITSGYRNKYVNDIVKGSKNSQHLSGKAADFTVKGMSVNEIINIIKSSEIEFDQLINEYNKWVHISFNKGKNRKQILKY